MLLHCRDFSKLICGVRIEGRLWRGGKIFCFRPFCQLLPSMKALVKSQPATSYVLTDVALPKPGPDQVLIKVERVSVRINT
jgi:hypothetical protein